MKFSRTGVQHGQQQSRTGVREKLFTGFDQVESLLLCEGKSLCWKQRYLWKGMRLGFKRILTSFFSSCLYFYRLLTFLFFSLFPRFSLLDSFWVFYSPPSVVSAEVEMTSYALLTYTLLGDVASALPVVKWLSQQRNALGGFSSTQVGCLQKRSFDPRTVSCRNQLLQEWPV